MNWQSAQKKIYTELQSLYEETEARVMTEMLLEALDGLSRTQRLLHLQAELGSAREAQLENYLKELLAGRPIQYVIQKAWFLGRCFYVDASVLIPRPETEEIVQHIIEAEQATVSSAQENKEDFFILDIGTGSGCIPISLKLQWPYADVWAMDISREAIVTAKKNAALLQAEVHFVTGDITATQRGDPYPPLDIMVSNPPYIPLSEKESLAPHVREYEPHAALFAPESDPLFFYRHIAMMAAGQLKKGGRLYTEVHAQYAADTAELFRKRGFTQVEIVADMQGKQRLVKAQKG